MLPDYEQPPVIEVVIGLEFLPLPGLGAIGLVGLRERWRALFPKAQEHVPIVSSGQPGIVIQGVGLQIGGGALPLRLWMISENEDKLLQVQNDRLVLNWRRLEGTQADGPYPRYKTLRPLFQDRLTDFMSYLTEEGIGDVQPTIAEVSFINAIEVPTGDPDLAHVLSTARHADLPGRLVQSQTELVLDVSTEVEAQGNTVITAQYRADNRLNLTVGTRLALGPADGTEQILSALDKAHNVGVNGFTSVTDPSMHEKWGRTA